MRARLLSLILVAAAFVGSQAGEAAKREAKSDRSDPQAYVDAHNAVRANVRKPTDYPGAWTPIPPVAWSEEVAAGAQEWAEHLRDNDCKLMHSDTRDGENLAGGKDVDATRAVALWANEGAHYRYAPVYEFEIPTAHYTQLVWRKSTLIGCGRAMCGSRAAVVCRYSPAGNHIGRAPY